MLDSRDESFTCFVQQSHYLEEYAERNWDLIRHSVGSYQLEGEGMRFFTAVEGITCPIPCDYTVVS